MSQFFGGRILYTSYSWTSWVKHPKLVLSRICSSSGIVCLLHCFGSNKWTLSIPGIDEFHTKQPTTGKKHQHWPAVNDVLKVTNKRCNKQTNTNCGSIELPTPKKTSSCNQKDSYTIPKFGTALPWNLQTSVEYPINQLPFKARITGNKSRGMVTWSLDAAKVQVQTLRIGYPGTPKPTVQFSPLKMGGVLRKGDSELGNHHFWRLC